MLLLFEVLQRHRVVKSPKCRDVNTTALSWCIHHLQQLPLKPPEVIDSFGIREPSFPPPGECEPGADFTGVHSHEVFS